MTVTPCKRDHDTLDGLLKAAVAAQFALGKELLGLVGTGVRAACDAAGLAKAKSDPCCDMPEACWMPKPLGEISCRVAPASKGQVKLIVTNHDYQPHKVTAQAAGPHAGMFSFAPAQIGLGPKERTTIVAEFAAPQQPGTYEAVLWVTVCSDHYLRWTIEVGEGHCEPCCYEVTVDDNPDYVDHWYDHFYCPKPCRGIHGRQG
ncbi:MAG TPA: hypothetical protein VFZ91_15225 [Allosphingosinicella sp.]